MLIGSDFLPIWQFKSLMSGFTKSESEDFFQWDKKGFSSCNFFFFQFVWWFCSKLWAQVAFGVCRQAGRHWKDVSLIKLVCRWCPRREKKHIRRGPVLEEVPGLIPQGEQLTHSSCNLDTAGGGERRPPRRAESKGRTKGRSWQEWGGNNNPKRSGDCRTAMEDLVLYLFLF